MAEEAICAACGKKRKLCGSARIKGVQQPRICKECLIMRLRTNDYAINDIFWIQQMIELNDKESIINLKEQLLKNDGNSPDIAGLYPDQEE